MKLHEMYKDWIATNQKISFSDYLREMYPPAAENPIYKWCAEQLNELAKTTPDVADILYKLMDTKMQSAIDRFRRFLRPRCPHCYEPLFISVDGSTIRCKNCNALLSESFTCSQGSILAVAEELIHGQRAKDYGDAKESFNQIATLWSHYLGHGINPQDVAMMMALLKMSRYKNSGYTHRDSLIDLAGYVALADEVSK